MKQKGMTKRQTRNAHKIAYFIFVDNYQKVNLDDDGNIIERNSSRNSTLPQIQEPISSTTASFNPEQPNELPDNPDELTNQDVGIIDDEFTLNETSSESDYSDICLNLTNQELDISSDTNELANFLYFEDDLIL